MRAARIVRLDGPAAVEVHDVAVPEPAEDEVLVRVRAAGVGFPEVLMSRGAYQRRPELPFTPGSEVAGEVVAAPAGSGLVPGDRVAAVCLLGGFAEYAVAPVDRTVLLPDDVSFGQGAAFAFNYGTAYFALLERGRLEPGEAVLVHGAAGGLGTAMLQTAQAFGAGRVVAVTSTDEKGALALDAGADEYVLAAGFRDTVARGGGGVDLVVDPVGGERFTDSLRCLRPDGRLVVVGFAAGDIPTVRVNRLLLRNVSVVGAGWVGYAFGRPGHVARELRALLPHLARGALRPVVGAEYALADAGRALTDLDERRARGKVVLRP